MIPSSCIRKSRRIPLGFNKKPEKSRPASMRLRKAGLSGFPVISYLQNRSISPKRPFFHNRKPMQKGDIAAVQRDPKDKTQRQLSYFIHQAFSRFNRKNLWIKGECCFRIGGKKPHKASLVTGFAWIKRAGWMDRYDTRLKAICDRFNQ